MKSMTNVFHHGRRRQPIAAPLECDTFHELSLGEATTVSGGRTWDVADAILAGGLAMWAYDAVFPPIGLSNYDYWTSRGVDLPPIE